MFKFSNFTAAHWTIVGGILTGLAVMVASLPSWQQATSPLFVAGVLTVIGTALKSISVDKPLG